MSPSADQVRAAFQFLTQLVADYANGQDRVVRDPFMQAANNHLSVIGMAMAKQMETQKEPAA